MAPRTAASSNPRPACGIPSIDPIIPPSAFPAALPPAVFYAPNFAPDFAPSHSWPNLQKNFSPMVQRAKTWKLI